MGYVTHIHRRVHILSVLPRKLQTECGSTIRVESPTLKQSLTPAGCCTNASLPLIKEESKGLTKSKPVRLRRKRLSLYDIMN